MCILSMKYSHKSGSVWITEDFIQIINRLNSYQMKTKEIDGVLYKLVPEEREKSCRGCVFKDQNGAICTILTRDCNRGLIYKKVDEPISNSRLKPFNLEAAKSGKPVCTRDGRKARIICFDAEGNKPLIVLSKINGQEIILRYTEKDKVIIFIVLHREKTTL